MLCLPGGVHKLEPPGGYQIAVQVPHHRESVPCKVARAVSGITRSGVLETKQKPWGGGGVLIRK